MQLRFSIVVLFVLSACSTPLGPRKPIVDQQQLAIDASLEDQAKEIEKRQVLVQKQQSFDDDTKNKNKEKASRIAKRAQELFEQGQFKKANLYYAKSIELDASPDKYYYGYGITLFKIDSFSKALATLNMLEGTDVNQTELNYYQGLCQLKMKNDEAALMKFKHVKEANDKLLSPLAAMYAGMIEKDSERFDEAKSYFNYILENSNDPQLDKRAETQIDDMLQTQQFIERSKQRWAYSAYVGTAYDDNVLNASQVNAASNRQAYRLLYGGAVSYKALYNKKNSLVPQFWLTDIYSFNDQMKTDSEVQASDPLQAEISVPYRYFLKSGTLTVNPSHQVLYMSLNQGDRYQVYDSTTAAVTYTTSYAEDWITNYKIDLARDNFQIKDTAPDDDQSSFRYSLLFSQTNLINDEGTKSWTMDLLYVNNNTEGDNFRYSKMLVGLGGTLPLKKSGRLVGYLRGDYFTMKFPDNSDGREDKALIVSLGAGYTLDDKSTIGFNMQYYNNGSTVERFDYSKFVINAIYSYNSGFF